MVFQYVNAIKIYFFTGVFLLISFGITSAQSDMFLDRDNCMLCHRYPNLGKYETNGKKRNFYVNGEDFSKSVHGRLRCTNCHPSLDKIPHTNVKKVDCSMQCHIDNYSSKQVFSHKKVVENFEASVHGKGNEKSAKPFPEDLPYCTYCHNNRSYYSRDVSKTSSAETMVMFRRPESQLRSQREVIDLCTSCHEDQEKMARHGLESSQTYKDTFHWEALKYANVDAPDCISCHVPIGYSSHTIRWGSDPLSSVNNLNRVKTCSNEGGLQTCHPGSTDAFASGRVHKYGRKAQLLVSKNALDGDKNANLLMIGKAINGISEQEITNYKIIETIRVIYKFLIGGTIGFMAFHQLLDYIRTRKKHKASHSV